MSEERAAQRHRANKRWYDAHREQALADKAAAYKADPAKFDARTSAWQKANPKRAAELSRTGKRTKQEIVAGRPRPDVCEVCEVPSRHTLHFDHCHATGDFRGWLCTNCNTALGHAKDNPETLMNLAAYLTAFQASLKVLRSSVAAPAAKKRAKPRGA